MRELARLNLTDQAIDKLWTEKLPPSFKPFLAMSDDLGLDELARIVDQINPVISISRLYKLELRTWRSSPLNYFK